LNIQNFFPTLIASREKAFKKRFNPIIFNQYGTKNLSLLETGNNVRQVLIQIFETLVFVG